ncbi:hypothetical protein [Desulfoluna butyratoxydans]|uniref:Uncharacterized protein n=1 Tax=Desulfoluna butyratoxydans TaxID=231438 RepID=A0A4U8YSB6_9BACT|nr:hypothetical protein [Desulfoluna butyratoxydans]VFQ44173.1 hypothetical protein MSL71_18170 [Desulfoluna butyratoxydans]
MMEKEFQENAVEKSDESSGVQLKNVLMNEGITAIWIDKLLDCFRQDFFSDFFEKSEAWLIKCGLYGLYIVGILGLLTSLIFPIRYNALPFMYSFGIGVSWVLLCVVLHYTAYKFVPNMTNIISSTPTKMSSEAFLNSIALISGLCGVVSLLAGIFFWIKTSSFNSFVIGLFSFVFCEYMLALSLNPNLLNINIDKNISAGEEFIGILSFFVKSNLKIIPIIFGSGIVLSIISLIGAMFTKFNYIPEITAKMMTIGGFTLTALLPFVGYLLFLSYYFVLDLVASVISIPSKIDALNQEK